MSIKPKTVFISYRRTNFYTALAVYQDLTKNGYDCFFDYESIESGSWEEVIFENIRYRAHFVLILSPSALERLGEKNAIMRREVELAIDEKRNIIPVMMESFDFGSPSAKEALTGKLESLSSYNGLKLVPEYIFASMEKLRRFLNVELETVRQPALSAIVQEGTEKRKKRVKKEVIVQEDTLTAEKWFEQGFKNQTEKHYKEAVRFYKKVLKTQPNHIAAYSNLGAAFNSLKRYEEAYAVYEKAINCDTADEITYNNFGHILIKLQRYKEAENAYKKAIEIGPKNEQAYNNLGFFLAKTKQYREAEIIYRKTIEIFPESARAYSDLALLLHEKFKRFMEAEDLYREAIKINPSYAATYYNQGLLYEKKGDRKHAIISYQKYLDLGGGDKYSNKEEVENIILALKEIIEVFED